jgi:hypothetical protein
MLGRFTPEGGLPTAPPTGPIPLPTAGPGAEAEEAMPPGALGSFRFFSSRASQRCTESSVLTAAAKVWSFSASGRHWRSASRALWKSQRNLNHHRAHIAQLQQLTFGARTGGGSSARYASRDAQRESPGASPPCWIAQNSPV